MKNYLLHSLAIVGAISLIIMACSADNSTNSNNNNSPNATNALGRYQVSTDSYLGSSGGWRYMSVIDTETGVVKTYRALSSNDYTLITTTTTQP